MIRLILTDMDGTVVDSMDFLRELAVSIVAAHGDASWVRPMRALYLKTFGAPIASQFRTWNAMYGEAYGQIDADRFTVLYESVHELAARHFPFTDFGRSLISLSGKGVKTALVTSTAKKIVSTMPQLRSIHWSYSGGTAGPGTDKRMQIKEAIEKLDVHRNECIYVGDAPSDRDIADELGIRYFYPSGLVISEVFPVTQGTSLVDVMTGG